MLNASKEMKISQAITPTNGAAGATDINGAIFDMQDFEGNLIEVIFGAITAGAATSIKVQHGDAANLSDAADLEGTSQTIADTDDDKVFYIDLVKPTKRYGRLVVKRATQNAVVQSATYHQYGAKKTPVVHGTNVAGETHVSPAAGTA